MSQTNINRQARSITRKNHVLSRSANISNSYTAGNVQSRRYSKTYQLGTFTTWSAMRLKTSSINPPIILRFEHKAYIQSDFFCDMSQILQRKSCRCGCQKYMNRRAKRIALKKDCLKCTIFHFYANVHKHLFKPGDP